MRFDEPTTAAVFDPMVESADVARMFGVPELADDLVRLDKVLHPYDGRIVAAWVGGSRLHGLARPGSDADLRVLVLPRRDDMLFGRSDDATSAHDPDVVVETVPHWRHGVVVDNSPLALESLAAVGTAHMLVDDGLLVRDVAALAADLVSANTVDIAVRMARAILDKRLRHTHGEPLTREQGKLLAEAYRLADTAVALADDGGPWPAAPRDGAPAMCRALRDERRVAGGTDDSDKVVAFVAGFVDNAARMVRIDHAGLDSDKHNAAVTAARDKATGLMRERLLDWLDGTAPGLPTRDVIIRYVAYMAAHKEGN